MKTKLKLINEAFDALRWAFDHCSPNHAERLLDLCKEEEKGHRGFMPDFAKYHTAKTIGVTQAAKLFAVKRVAEYLEGERMPAGKDYLHFQKSAFYAAGMVDEYSKEITTAWTNFDLAALASLNYTDFVKVKTEAA